MTGPIARQIIEETAAKHNMTVDHMLDKRRDIERLDARWAAAKGLRAVTRENGKPRFTVMQIGAALRMHHTTVCNALKHGTPYRGTRK